MERETDQKKEGQQVTAVKTKADQLNCKHYKQYKREPDPFTWDIILPLQKKHQRATYVSLLPMMVVRIMRPRMRDVNITRTRSRSDLSSSLRLEVRFTEEFIITFGSPGVRAGLSKFN